MTKKLKSAPYPKFPIPYEGPSLSAGSINRTMQPYAWGTYS